MKKDYKKLKYIRDKKLQKFIIFSILVIMIFIVKVSKNIDQGSIQDDIIFFKLLENKSINKNKENNKNKYINDNRIKIDMSSKKQVEIDQLNLLELTNKKTKIREKIAPGSEGNFELQLLSNMNMKYNVEFKEISEKPQNLLFYIDGKEYHNLEDINGKLNGDLIKNKKIKIVIYWVWKYETSNQNNKQDTKDGISLKTYCFKINAYSY